MEDLAEETDISKLQKKKEQTMPCDSFITMAQARTSGQ